MIVRLLSDKISKTNVKNIEETLVFFHIFKRVFENEKAFSVFPGLYVSSSVG